MGVLGYSRYEAPGKGSIVLEYLAFFMYCLHLTRLLRDHFDLSRRGFYRNEVGIWIH